MTRAPIACFVPSPVPGQIGRLSILLADGSVQDAPLDLASALTLQAAIAARLVTLHASLLRDSAASPVSEES